MTRKHLKAASHALACALAIGLGMSAAQAQDAAYTVKMMTPETALKAAQAALGKCRNDGFQVTVAVVDRSGIVQVMLRDRYAGTHTLRMAADKAWTAVSFRTDTGELEKVTRPGMPQSAIRQRPRVAPVAGGLMIEGGGSLLGGIGVSGAPGGDRDEICARAGIAAIQDSIDF